MQAQRELFEIFLKFRVLVTLGVAFVPLFVRLLARRLGHRLLERLLFLLLLVLSALLLFLLLSGRGLLRFGVARTLEDRFFAILTAVHLVQHLVAFLVLEESFVDFVILKSLQANSHVVSFDVIIVFIISRI